MRSLPDLSGPIRAICNKKNFSFRYKGNNEIYTNAALKAGKRIFYS